MPHNANSQFVAALVVSVTLFSGCDRADSPSGPTTQWVDPNKLGTGPIRHATLTEDQISRVAKVQKSFSEVDPSPIEKWLEDFRRDADPERELAIWEEMASAYESFTASNSLSLDGKKEVFQVVLLRSGSPDEEVLKHLELKTLTDKDARAIMALFTTKPAPIRVSP
jgi:hypothetical protein